MHDDRAQFEAMLDAYLAGELTDEAKRSFERMVESRPDMRRALQLQRDIDRSIGSQFDAPPALTQRALAGATGDTARTSHWQNKPWAMRFAIAAIVLLGVYGAWSTWNFIFPPTAGYSHIQPWRDPLAVYHDTIAAGFKPAWVCKDEAEFRQTTRSSLGRSLTLATADDPSVRVVGIAYSNTLSTFTVLILAMVDQQPVIVFADRARADRKLPNPATGSDLSWTRREVEGLVFYELSPFDDARVLPLISVPPDDGHSHCLPVTNEMSALRPSTTS